MTDLRKAAEIALEALDGEAFGEYRRKVVEQLRQALAQPEQEPERIVPPVPDYAFDWCNFKKVDLMEGKQAPWQSVQCTCGGTIYFKHTKREWVGLTDGDFNVKQVGEFDVVKFAKYIETLLKERNFGSAD